MAHLLAQESGHTMPHTGESRPLEEGCIADIRGVSPNLGGNETIRLSDSNCTQLYLNATEAIVPAERDRISVGR